MRRVHRSDSVRNTDNTLAANSTSLVPAVVHSVRTRRSVFFPGQRIVQGRWCWIFRSSAAYGLLRQLLRTGDLYRNSRTTGAPEIVPLTSVNNLSYPCRTKGQLPSWRRVDARRIGSWGRHPAALTFCATMLPWFGQTFVHHASHVRDRGPDESKSVHLDISMSAAFCSTLGLAAEDFSSVGKMNAYTRYASGNMVRTWNRISAQTWPTLPQLPGSAAFLPMASMPLSLPSANPRTS